MKTLWMENFRFTALIFYFIAGMLMILFVYFLKLKKKVILLFDYLNSRHPNIKFTTEKEINHKLPFLDILIDNNSPNFSLPRVYRKNAFTRLLSNYFSFTSFSHWVSLVHSAYKINNTWLGFQEDISKVVVERVITDSLRYWDTKQSLWTLSKPRRQNKRIYEQDTDCASAL